jgi:small subunit ribosomal protein S20
MAHHKSALKRIRQTKKRRLYNRQNKKTVKEAIKEVRQTNSVTEAIDKLNSAYRILDKAGARGILHKNTVAHRKSSLSSFVNKLKAKQA